MSSNIVYCESGSIKFLKFTAEASSQLIYCIHVLELCKLTLAECVSELLVIIEREEERSEGREWERERSDVWLWLGSGQMVWQFNMGPSGVCVTQWLHGNQQISAASLLSVSCGIFLTIIILQSASGSQGSTLHICACYFEGYSLSFEIIVWWSKWATLH